MPLEHPRAVIDHVTRVSVDDESLVSSRLQFGKERLTVDVDVGEYRLYLFGWTIREQRLAAGGTVYRDSIPVFDGTVGSIVTASPIQRHRFAVLFDDERRHFTGLLGQRLQFRSSDPIDIVAVHDSLAELEEAE